MRKNTTNTDADTKPMQRVVPRGQAIVRTDTELDDMTSAAAMEKLVEEAASDWIEHAPKNYKSLLDSE